MGGVFSKKQPMAFKRDTITNVDDLEKFRVQQEQMQQAAKQQEAQASDQGADQKPKG